MSHIDPGVPVMPRDFARRCAPPMLPPEPVYPRGVAAYSPPRASIGVAITALLVGATAGATQVGNAATQGTAAALGLVVLAALLAMPRGRRAVVHVLAGPAGRLLLVSGLYMAPFFLVFVAPLLVGLAVAYASDPALRREIAAARPRRGSGALDRRAQDACLRDVPAAAAPLEPGPASASGAPARSIGACDPGATRSSPHLPAPSLSASLPPCASATPTCTCTPASRTTMSAWRSPAST